MLTRSASLSPLLVALGLAPVVLGATGCAFFRSLSGMNTVDLKGAEVIRMSVDIRKQQKTICPREAVQMGVFLDAKLKGDDKPKSLETWAGPAGTNRNGKLDFGDFAFDSPLGTFDADGFFTPAKDMRVSAGNEFKIKAVYRARPDKFSFDLAFKPDYGCVNAAKLPGNPGNKGSTGGSGASGQSGKYGGSSPGGRGGNGATGSTGGAGGDGGDGPRLQAYATFVKTPYYPKLLAVRIRGERDDLLLAPPDRAFVIEARGGNGGDGGDGGNGGPGGGGGAGNPAGDGGNGGNGGDGSSGGKGGHGGEVEIFFDPAYPELAELVKADVAGGDPGRPGHGGTAGTAGTGGSGTSSGQGQAPKSGTSGAAGAAGRSGAAGAAGPAGRSLSRPGEVGSQINGTDITLLSAVAAPAPAPAPAPSAPPPPAKPQGKKKK